MVMCFARGAEKSNAAVIPEGGGVRGFQMTGALLS